MQERLAVERFQFVPGLKVLKGQKMNVAVDLLVICCFLY